MKREPDTSPISRAIAASYAGQIYATAIGVVTVPFYLRYMGPEAYGLVGFHVMLQMWFSLLDFGLTPTVSRETARFRGGALDAASFRGLLGKLERWFLGVAVVGASLLFFGAPRIADQWLHAQNLAQSEIVLALELTAGIVALRWMAGLWRGVINGFEQQVWLAGVTSLIATLRFVGVIPVLIWQGGRPAVFFTYQLGVAVLELACMYWRARTLMPRRDASAASATGVALGPLLRFSLTIAFTSLVWVLITQTDKLILSGILPLAEYGHFTLAVMVASAVMLISGPVSTTVMPRMARLESAGEHAQMILVYRQATQVVAVIAGATAATLCVLAEPLLRVWVDDPALAREVAPVLQLYAVGNGVLSVCAFPYYLQYAKGDLRLHLIGNLIFVVLMVPAIVWAARNHGAIGAATVWVGINVLTLVAWLPFVHHRFAPHLNRRWYDEDVGRIAVACAFSAWGLGILLPMQAGRWVQLALIAIAGLLVLLAGTAASSAARAAAFSWWKARRAS